ncbi:T9SS type A sorting domain-containing protein [Chryseobacterium sp. MMS23-Vi53]|uniref:T9SS type A sorting domain-containing protein n=1 Tax=Chryseobacterium sp. MMS23-Vi53 TaxID=3386644 RepID=UPI0039EB2960
MKKIYTTLLIAFSMYSYAQTLNTQLNEIHFGSGSSPYNLIKLNDLIIFAASKNTDEGLEPWVYNSTTQKSTLLKDIFAGYNSGIPPNSIFVKLNNKVYFLAQQNYSGYQIWETDGTPAGTVKKQDINSNYSIDEFVVAGNKIFYYQNNALWSFDTASNNSSLLKTFEYSGNVKLYSYNNQVILAANDGISGKEIWKSDGTVAGTALIKDIAPNNGNSISNDFKIVTLNNGKFYFMANTATGYMLYESDGTSAGTNPLMPMQNTPQLEGASGGNYFVFIGFSATNGGSEPWISDGTVAGTKLLKDIYPGTTSSMGLNQKFLKLGNKIYFDSSSNGNPGYGNYIWETDGTEAGTVLFNTPINNVLYGKSSDGQYLILTKPNEWSRFWITNGNSAQTFEMSALGMTAANGVVDFNSKVYLAGTTAKHGMELYTLDPITQVATLASDISKYESSSPHSYELLNDNLIFIAADREFNNQFYKRDKNTQQITRLSNFTSGSSSVGMFTNFNDTFFKVGNFLYTKNSTPNPMSGFYRTDGTSANSIGISTGNTVLYDNTFFANLNDNTLLFSGYNNVIGTELWKIDNNSNTFSLVKDISTDSMGSMYNTDSKITVLNGYAYFVAKENGKLAIWKSDGTEANTTKAVQVNFQDGTDGDIKVLGNFNNKLLFTSRKEGSSNYGQTELYASNGDQASTVLLKSHNVSFSSANIDRDTEILNNKLFYFASDYPSGIYSTDGTVAGTTEVFTNGNFYGDIKLKKCGSQIFFTHNNSTELWKTDGTTSGTMSLGANFQGIKDMVCTNNYLYFLNGDSQKVWRSNGVSGGTVPLDIFITNDDNQLLTNENILKLATDNEKLFLTIYTKEHGNELYTVTDPLPVFLAVNDTAVNSKAVNPSIQIYPNPVSDEFSLNVQNDYKVEGIKVFDASGKLMKNILNFNGRVNISELSVGIYFIKIKTNKGEFLSKILKK